MQVKQFESKALHKDLELAGLNFNKKLKEVMGELSRGMTVYSSYRTLFIFSLFFFFSVKYYKLSPQFLKLFFSFWLGAGTGRGFLSLILARLD